MTTLNILFIAPVPPPITGQSVACKTLFDELVENGHEISLINLSKQSFRQGFDSIDRFFEIFRVILQILRRPKSIDLVYFTPAESIAGNLKDLAILCCLGELKKNTVLHLHGGAGMRILLSNKHPIIRALNHHFLKQVKAVIVLGDRLKDIYDGIVPPENLYGVPNFSGDDFFVDEDNVEIKFSNTLPLRILFLSNLLPGKGHQELLEALSLLPIEIRKKIKVDFAGGFESNEAEKRFNQNVLQMQGANITIHGIVDGQQKQELLRNAHLFCLPTYYQYEGQPISILEAYASGCAVMTTNHSGIFDTFTPGVNGIEVVPKSPQSIANAILWSISNITQLHKFGDNNLKTAQEKYRPAIHVKALKKILSD